VGEVSPDTRWLFTARQGSLGSLEGGPMHVPAPQRGQPRRVSTLEGKPIQGGELLVTPLVLGHEMVLLEIHYPAGVSTPLHCHTHESVIYVLRGKLRSTIEEQVFVLGPGDVCRHPKGVMHAVEALEDSVILECKSPAPDISVFMA
jgi:quercetin dioxygenase-like cupin family protein